MALLVTITNAGRAEMIAAENTGTEKVTIVAVALGTGRYLPAKTQTALQAEIKRVTTIAGRAVADDTIHVVAQDESADAYNVGEFGLISDKGTLIAVYSQLPADGWIIQKAAPSTLLLATDIILESLDATVIEFGDISFINPPATAEVAGVTKLINNLASPDAASALTAAMGKKLQDEKQPKDATLTALAALVTAANQLIYSTGADQFALATLSAFARTLLDDADAATARTTLGAAPLNSPGFTGSPTAPTQPLTVNNTLLATTAYVQAAVAALVNSSPAALDTLKELADALGNDPNFATTMTTALASKQPLDATLTALAGLVTGANQMIYSTGADTFALSTLSAFARTLLDDADAATARTTLAAAPLNSPGFTGSPTAPTQPLAVSNNLLATTAYVQAAVAALVNSSPAALDTLKELADALGNDPDFATTMTNALASKQPLDATLTALAGLVTGANQMIYSTGADTFALSTLSAFARTLLDDADAAAARTTLGANNAGNLNAGTLPAARLPDATETAVGGMRVATQQEVDAGTRDDVAVTPKKLRWGVSLLLGPIGYVSLPSWLGGVIFQWGYVSVTSTGSGTTGEGLATFATTFPNEVWACPATHEQSAGGVGGVSSLYQRTLTTSGVRFGLDEYSGGIGTTTVRYISVGR